MIPTAVYFLNQFFRIKTNFVNCCFISLVWEVEGVEHFGGYPQHSSMSTVWDTITTVGDSGNDVKDVGYSQGIHSVL